MCTVEKSFSLFKMPPNIQYMGRDRVSLLRSIWNLYPIDFSARVVRTTHLRVAVADVGGRVDAVEVLVPPVVVDVLLAGAGDVHAGAGGIGAHRRAAADPVSKRGEGHYAIIQFPIIVWEK